MKIIIVSPSNPYRGGIANFTDLLYSELIQSCETHIYNFKRLYPNFLFPGKTQYESTGRTDIKSFEVIDSINPVNWVAVGNKIKKEKPDYLLLTFWLPFFAPCLGTISRIVKKNNFTKIIAICHNIVPHEKRIGDSSLTKYFFHKSDKFVLLSSKVEDELLSINPKAKFVTLYHPVYSHFGNTVDEHEAKKYLKIKSEKVILFFGFIRKYKGLDTLLKAAVLLKSKMDFEVIVAGEFYESEEKYLSLISELSLKDNVRLFKDFIPTSNVKYFFSAADVVVLPYKNATQSGIVQIANNFEKPVIATNVGGLGEVIEENVTGNLVEKENPEQLANAILNYYEQNKKIEYSKNIKEKLDQYSWTNFVKELLSFIKMDNTDYKQ